MFVQILESIAEFEHGFMSERTRDGLAAARPRGRVGGPKPELRPRQAELAREMYDRVGADGKAKFTVAQTAAEFGSAGLPSTATAIALGPAMRSERVTA